jgi:hypothetical protein
MQTTVNAASTKPSPKTGCARAPNAKVETVMFADIHWYQVRRVASTSRVGHMSHPPRFLAGCEAVRL